MLGLQQMKPQRVIRCLLIMAFGVLIAAFFGAFFWVPNDVDAYSQGMREFQQAVKGGDLIANELPKVQGQLSTEVPPNGWKVLWNSAKWRPWLVLPFVLFFLYFARPSVRECFMGAIFLALILASLDLVSSAAYLVISTVLFAATVYLRRKFGSSPS